MLVMVYFQTEQMERSPGGHLFNGNGNCETERATGFSVNSLW